MFSIQVDIGTHAVLCTNRRLLYVRAGAWERNWQVAWQCLKGVEFVATQSAVRVQLFASREACLSSAE